KIKNLINVYHRRYNGGEQWDDKSEDFRIKLRGGKELPLHRHIYCKEISEDTRDKHIHHIDNDPLHNESWNLITRSEQDHSQRLDHRPSVKGDWYSGIKELQRQLHFGTRERPFPPHIRERMEG